MTHPLAKVRAEGYTAAPGDPNPYAGQTLEARMWRLGYLSMLADAMRDSPARQHFTQ